MVRPNEEILRTTTILVCAFSIVSEALRCRYGGKVRHYGRVISIPGGNQTCLPTTHYCLKLEFDFLAHDGRYKGVLRLCDSEMTGFKEKFCLLDGCVTQYEHGGGRARVCCCSTDFCDPSGVLRYTAGMVPLLALLIFTLT